MSQVLKEYSQFMETVQNYQISGVEEPYKKAIKECVEKGILADYLMRKGSEVVNMLLDEYDYETISKCREKKQESKGEQKAERKDENKDEQREKSKGRKKERRRSKKKKELSFRKNLKRGKQFLKSQMILKIQKKILLT